MFGIRKAIGLGLTLVVLKLLVAPVFLAIQDTLLIALSTAGHAFQVMDRVLQ